MKTFRIVIDGTGGELTIGNVSAEEKEILSNPDKELIELVNEDLEEVCGWSEIDDQLHCFGVTEPFEITIYDENGDVVYELDDDSKSKYDTDDFELFEYECPEIDENADVLVCFSTEKGRFFDGVIEVEDEFDITKLKIKIYTDIEVSEFYYGDIMEGVYYNDEEIGNDGGDTVGKSFDVYKNF